MDTIQIHSKLYGYTVDFINDFTEILAGLQDETAFVIDKNVYRLYEKKFNTIDEKKIYFIDPIEDNKTMDTVMELILFWKELGVRKNWKILCFGGGISQDVATIASNLFLRNIEW